MSMAFPGGSVAKNPPVMQERRISSWVGKIPCRRKWQPTPVFVPGESHGQKSLVAYSPWGCKELNTTERLNNYNKMWSLSEYCSCFQCQLLTQCLSGPASWDGWQSPKLLCLPTTRQCSFRVVGATNQYCPCHTENLLHLELTVTKLMDLRFIFFHVFCPRLL